MSQAYCDFCAALPANTINPNKAYHDTEYGVPVQDDNILFERLVLEINQAGLSWTTILNKRAAFQAAYAQFNIAAVAAFGEADIARLLGNAGIIRNRLKIQAAIHSPATRHPRQDHQPAAHPTATGLPPRLYPGGSHSGRRSRHHRPCSMWKHQPQHCCRQR